MTRRICFALDLQNGEDVAALYDRMHATAVPPAVNANLRAVGVLGMEIWRVADRLMMMCEVADDFVDFGQTDADDPTVRQWDSDMARLQKAIPESGSGSWAEMRRVYNLVDQP